MTAVTTLAMLALLAMTLITSEGKRDALLRNQELVDAALEGLVIAKDGIIVNVNRRILEPDPQLTRTSSWERRSPAIS